jgi:GH18 family chitinase
VLPEDLFVNQYSHLNYAFAFIDPNTFAIAPMAEMDKELYARFTALKQQNQGLETWVRQAQALFSAIWRTDDYDTIDFHWWLVDE